MFNSKFGLNVYGHEAFINKDISRPNETFFQHVDYVINKAESLGLYMGVVPAWAVHNVKVIVRCSINPKLTAMVSFLGNRYRDKPIIWVLGGDWYGEGVEDIWISMAKGLMEGDGGTHLITYHPLEG